jgi:peptide chain release factor subunit 1
MTTVEQIASLRSERSNNTTLISYYIRGDSANLTGAFLRNELQQSNNIKAKATRDGVQSALRAIMRTLKDINRIPLNGLAVFAG